MLYIITIFNVILIFSIYICLFVVIFEFSHLFNAVVHWTALPKIPLAAAAITFAPIGRSYRGHFTPAQPCQSQVIVFTWVEPNQHQNQHGGPPSSPHLPAESPPAEGRHRGEAAAASHGLCWG